LSHWRQQTTTQTNIFFLTFVQQQQPNSQNHFNHSNMTDSKKTIYTGRANQSSNFDKVAGSGQEDLKKSNYNVGEPIDNGADLENLNHIKDEPIDNGAHSKNLNHNTGEPTVSDRADLKNLNHNNGEPTVKDESNLGNANHINGEPTVNYTAMAREPQPYQHQFCTSCGAVDHRFARCPNAPVNNEGYVEGCGGCNALDHAVTECKVKKLKPRDLYFYLVTCRNGLPPMVASQDPREVCPTRWGESPHRPIPPSVALARARSQDVSPVSEFDLSRWDHRNRFGNYILDRQIHSRYRTQAGPEQVRIPNPTESNEPKAAASNQGGPSASGDSRGREKGRGSGRGWGIGRGRGGYNPSDTAQWVENNSRYQRGGTVSGSVFGGNGSSRGQNYQRGGSVAGSVFGGNGNFRGHNNYRDRGRGRGSGHYDDYRRPAPVPLEEQDSNLAEKFLDRLATTLDPKNRMELAVMLMNQSFKQKAEIQSSRQASPGPRGGVGWARSAQDSGPRRATEAQNQNTRQRDIALGNVGGNRGRSGSSREIPRLGNRGGQRFGFTRQNPPTPIFGELSSDTDRQMAEFANETEKPAESGEGGGE
jgi:hypothetical protein